MQVKLIFTMKALFTNIQARGRATNVIATRRRNVDDSAIKNAELVTACNAKHATNEDAVKFEIDEMTIDQIVAANRERNELMLNAQHYDPITGEGSCGPRVKRSVDIDDSLKGDYWIPEPMAAELDAAPCTTRTQWELLRIRHDFEFWCAAFIMILDKVSGRLVNLVLNGPQRRVLRVLEEQRLAGKPLRLIMLKARQWGGSTLVQLYMAWIQLVLKSNWNSLICGHMHQTSAAIKAMYERALRNYPEHLTPNGKRPKLAPFEGSRCVRQLSGSESLVISGSARSQDSVRGYDIKMAHLTEVAFWPSTTLHSPDEVIRSIGGTIPLEPLTMLVLESTANGVGNYFHDEWLRSKAGESDKEAVFVPWYEIEIYRMPVASVEQLVSEMDDYEKWLWQDCNCTLEMINWYHHKRREYPNQSMMAAEFPTTDIEAFTSTATCMFTTPMIDRMRYATTNPAVRGDIVARGMKSLDGINFVRSDNGPLELWRWPEQKTVRNRYIVAVDVGGTTPGADWSVIAVIDRHAGQESLDNVRPEVVAQWRGHIHHDHLAWKAAQIARYYNNALLVIESNSIESQGDVGQLIFKQIMAAYKNVYMRKSGNGNLKPGFQTNRESKISAIYNLIAYVRDGSYIERDNKAVDEMACYELKPGGKGFGARKGKHDDILMTRAIALMIIEEMRIQSGHSRAKNPEYFVVHPTLFHLD